MSHISGDTADIGYIAIDSQQLSKNLFKKVPKRDRSRIATAYDRPIWHYRQSPAE